MFGTWKRKRWSTPPGFFTPLATIGDPEMDRPGRREELYMRVFSTADGRVVLADILALAGIGRSDFQPGVRSEDAHFNSGVKAGALAIAERAGLHTGALGRALVTGRLEAMSHGENDDEIPPEE